MHITSPTIDQASCHVDGLSLKEHNIKSCIPPAASLFKDYNTPIPELETAICTSLDDLSDTVNISDKLFFIQYTPEGTMRRRWYLIQVDMESTLEANPDFITKNLYLCVLLSRHPDDNRKSDEL